MNEPVNPQTHDELAATAATFWDREVVERTHKTWMAPPEVRAYINTSIGGDASAWPLNWFVKQYGDRVFARGLSIGCGPGDLERDLIRRGICTGIDAFDISQGSLAIARDRAAAEGMTDRIHYFAADFNAPSLPRNAYDIVFFPWSMHHVAKLEKILRAVLHALRPGGLLYFEEYIGPSSREWTREQFRTQLATFASLPREWKVVDELPYPINPSDPSEAIRSSEILPQVRVGFDIEHKRDFGGNLLSTLYPFIDWSVASPDTITRLIDAEKEILRTGAPSFHAVVVARPKRGVRKLIAGVRYFVEPKVKRIGRALR
jgi:SAM-dependent methyltransferase